VIFDLRRHERLVEAGVGRHGLELRECSGGGDGALIGGVGLATDVTLARELAKVVQMTLVIRDQHVREIFDGGVLGARHGELGRFYFE
jgi:nitrogen regulatory protein PII